MTDPLAQPSPPLELTQPGQVSPHAKAARMAELIEATLGRFW